MGPRSRCDRRWPRPRRCRRYGPPRSPKAIRSLTPQRQETPRMCGIAGFVADSSPGDVAHQSPARLEAEFSLVHRMCEVIRHRGPDDEGIHVEPGVGLGMRRLSIIDLAGGRQPMHNETRTIWIVFNGEIYNYRELRR